jgi:hypothetical protein
VPGTFCQIYNFPHRLQVRSHGNLERFVEGNCRGRVDENRDILTQSLLVGLGHAQLLLRHVALDEDNFLEYLWVILTESGEWRRVDELVESVADALAFFRSRQQVDVLDART